MKLIFSRKSCIGAGECEAVSPELWKLGNDGRANLKDAKLNPETEEYELEVDDDMAQKQKIVVGSCPSGCIKIHNG